MTILDKIVAVQKTVVARQKKAVPLKKILTALDKPLDSPRFAKTILRGGIHLIAEIKKASPSAGVIRKDFDCLAIARAYEASGASCISVLTENTFFQGRLSYFDDVRDAVTLPLLRKDFLIDTYQIYESKLHQADAVLLIAALLGPLKLKRFLALAQELKVDALVEVHDKSQLAKALDAGASLIGINMLKKVPKGIGVVAESGVKTLADLAFFKTLDIHAVLVGEALMRARDLGARTRAFVDTLRP
jgi:indole-3-glycerol phosphate synthase